MSLFFKKKFKKLWKTCNKTDPQKHDEIEISCALEPLRQYSCINYEYLKVLMAQNSFRLQHQVFNLEIYAQSRI